MNNEFGWNYPPGAERDSRAPWNEREEDEPGPDEYDGPDRTEGWDD